jgi:hypothetical protein
LFIIVVVTTEIFILKEKNIYYWRKLVMWVITAYDKESTTMYEFNTEDEAREALKNIPGCKILTEDIYDYGLVAI